MVTPVPVVPSPKFQAKLTTAPSGSVLADASKLTVCPALGLVGANVKDATGARSFIVSVVVPAPGPALLVAVTVIVKVCDFAVPVDA